VFVFYLLDDSSHWRGHSALLAAIAPIAGLSAYRTLFQSTLVGQDRLRAFSFIAIVDSLFPLFGIVCLFGLNFLSVTSTVIVNFLSLVITCLVLYRISRFSGSLQFNYQLAKKSVNYGWKSWVNNLANQALYKVDVFIIGFMLDLSSVGIYTVGVLIIEKCWYLSGAIGNAIYPKLKNMDIYKGSNLAALAAKSNLYITSFGAIVISIFSVWIIKMLFGDDYYGSALVIVLLAPGIIFLAVPKILVSHLAAKDKLELAVQASLTALIVNLVANVLFIPFAGIYGAAIASSLAYLVYLVIYLLNYIKLTKLSIADIFIFKSTDIKFAFMKQKSSK
jgi:O-antigen/teichoic acid export membrane protein